MHALQAYLCELHDIRSTGAAAVTNYRDFVLLGQDADGRPVTLETYCLAADEKAFWKAAAHPAANASDHLNVYRARLRTGGG